MCGIAGIALSGRSNPGFGLRERLTAMAESMRHRGPDDQGIELSCGDRAGLASRRLAIRDLSPAGHMPMGNAEGSVWIAYNGEVYDTGDLRRELESLGYAFRSDSDTEVILRGYEAWGGRIVERLRGMFAFAILDLRSAAEPILFLARDRLGIKPLFYSQTREGFLFASEIKGLMASGMVRKEMSPAGLVGYLMMGSAPNPLTIYREIHALEPGCTLTLPIGSVAEPCPSRYWSMPTDRSDPASYEEAVEEIRALLEESVRIRLVSDVPLGAFLSGGLDSSVVVGLMRKATRSTIRTCSMIFDEAEFSEAPYARAMSEAAGTEHYERVITAHDVTREWSRILWAMDQPTCDGVNSYFVSQTAREAGLTVALSGLGGDELFGGYPNTFQGVPQMLRTLQRLRSAPGGAMLARGASHLLPSRRYWAKARDALARPISPASAYLARRGVFSPTEVKRLVTQEVWEAATAGFDPVEQIASRAGGPCGGDELFAWISRAELSVYTHHQLLRDTDAMSMAHSLEVRVPLLDHRLVEAALRLPASMKSGRPYPKPLLTDAAGENLASAVRDRRDKRGFTFPFDTWMREILRKPIEEDLAEGLPARLLRPGAAQGVWQSFQAGKMHWSRAWTLAALAGWMAHQGLTEG